MLDIAFRMEHEQWLEQHLRRREGERRRRLATGHGKAERLLLENVLWPAIGSLGELHPEYEAVPLNGKSYYLDIAFVRWPLLVDFEADGFVPHAKNINRDGFAAERRRDVQLQLGGWRIVRLAYDDIETRPLELQQAVRSLMQRWTHELRHVDGQSLPEKTVIQFARMNNQTVTIEDVRVQLAVCDRTARTLLKGMTARGLLHPAGGGKERVRRYKLSDTSRLWI